MKRWICAGLALLGLLSLVPEAARATNVIYCLRGGSTGQVFEMQLFVRSGGMDIPVFLGGGGLPAAVSITAPVSGNTSGIRAAMVAAINDGAIPRNPALPAGSFSAALDFTDPNCPGWDTAFNVTWSSFERFYMQLGGATAGGTCNVGKDDGDPNTFGICQFNPEIVQAGGDDPPPPLQGGIPTLSEWATGLLVLLMATSMVWILRRRRDEVA